MCRSVHYACQKHFAIIAHNLVKEFWQKLKHQRRDSFFFYWSAKKRLIRYTGFFTKFEPVYVTWQTHLLYHCSFNSQLLQAHTSCSILLKNVALAVFFGVLFSRHSFIISTTAQGSHTPILLLPLDNIVPLPRNPSSGPEPKVALIVQGLNLLLFSLLFSLQGGHVEIQSVRST